MTPEEIKKYVPYWADLAERYNQSFEDFQWEHHRMEEMTTDAMIHILPLLTALAAERKRVEELEDENRRQREALSFYGSESTYDYPKGVRGLSQESYCFQFDSLIAKDKGTKARAVLLTKEWNKATQELTNRLAVIDECRKAIEDARVQALDEISHPQVACYASTAFRLANAAIEALTQNSVGEGK